MAQSLPLNAGPSGRHKDDLFAIPCHWPSREDIEPDRAATGARELDNIIDGDRFPRSPFIPTLKAILAKLRPEPVREPTPPTKQYQPPSKGRCRRRK